MRRSLLAVVSLVAVALAGAVRAAPPLRGLDVDAAQAGVPPAQVGASAADPCRALDGLVSGDARVLVTQTVREPNFHAADGHGYAVSGPFCRVVAQAHPAPESNIIIEIWLPPAAAWNGKLLGAGNGGFGGVIRYAALAGGLKRGYAVANTEMGTYPANIVGGSGYDAGNGRPEIVKDWGFRATHEMAVLTRVVAEQYYRQRPKRAYYAGCSTGGHQGLTEAQRYPDDYDAILAGAPGNNRTHLHTAFTWFGVISSRPGAYIPEANMALWMSAFMTACVGKDGGAPTDAFLTQPTQCQFEPKALLCKPGQDAKTCLDPNQVQALEAIYGGVRNPRTGKLIYPAEVKGSEAIWGRAFTTPPGGAARPVAADLARWVFGQQFDGAKFDFDHDMAAEDAALGPDVNALDPDLSRFAAHGGKLILFHGWADAVVSPLDTVLYYERITTRDGAPAKADFVRLFMAPGVSHCGGGVGPDFFGQGAEFTLDASDPDDDLLAALDRWSETDVAPEQVLAVKYAGSSPFGGPPPPGASVELARPICAYPKVARYDGKGDPKLATSFACAAEPPVQFEKPAPEYLR